MGTMVAMLLEDTLADLGCEVVGTASELAEVESMVASLAFDAAVLDVNLNGVCTFPIAEALSARRIPFVFSTRYGPTGIPDAFRAAPVLAKPFRGRDMEVALRAALDGVNHGT